MPSAHQPIERAAGVVGRRMPRLAALTVALLAACVALGVWSPPAHAAISLVGHASANTGSGSSSVSVSRPFGTRAGDVVVVGIQGDGSTAMSVPSGWTALYNTAAPYGWAMLLYKVAGSFEPSGYTFSLGTWREATAALSVWRGVDTADPIDAHAETGAFFWAWSTAPSVTTTAPNDVVVVGTTWSSNVTSYLPAGVTQLDLVRSSSQLTTHTGYFTQVSPGASPSKTFSASKYTNSGAGTFALQETSPPTLSGTSPGSPANANTVNVLGSSQPGWTVKLYTNSTCTSAIAATGTGAQLASGGLTVTVANDSTTTFWATATDAYGQVSRCSSQSVTYIEDSTPPAAPTIGSAPASPAAGRSPSWSFTGEAGASFQCRLDRGSTQVSDWTSCSSPDSFDLTGQPDGIYTFSVRAIDAAGNTGPAASSSYTLDTTPPAAPSITSAPTTPSSGRSPSWSFTGEAGATFECRLDRGGTQVAGWGACSGTKSYDLTGQPDGSYTFSVRATDAAGNTGATATSSFTLDTTAPAAPTITSAPNTPGSGRSPSWSFSGEAGATFQCRLDRGGTQVSDWAACSSSKSYDLSGQPDGSYTFSVRATDAAGNTGSAATSTYVLDTAAPATPTITSAPTTPASGRSPSWSFSGETGATFQCRLDRGGTQVSAWTACSDSAAYDLAGQPDGTYTFSVRATDAAGNTGPTATSSYTLDTAAPDAPAITPPSSPGSGRSPSWTFTAEAGATFQCRLDSGGTQISDWGVCASAKSYDLTGQPDGTYTFSVRASDAAGNTSAVSTSGYTLDTAAPAAPSITSAPSSPGNARALSWSFTGEPAASFQCRVDQTSGLGSPAVVSGWAACSSPAGYNLIGQPDGAYSFSVRAVDAAGNVGSASPSAYTLDSTGPAAPAIVSSPASPGNTRSPSWSFSAEAGATFQCRLDRSGTQISDWGACPSTQSYDLTGQPDGTYTLSVRAIDSVGNTGDTATSDYRLDTSAPAAPAITSVPGSPSPNPTPTWSFSGESGASFECKIDEGGTVISDWASCTSPKGYDLSSGSDGTYTFSVRAIDTAGNTGSAATSSYVLDRTSPGVPSIDSAPPPVGKSRSVSWAFSGDPGTTFECRLDQGATTVENWVACTSGKSYDLTGQPDGAYTFSVREKDGAGNAGAATTSSYTLDTQAPAAPTLDADPGPSGNNEHPSWSFSGEAGARLDCRLERGATVVSDWTTCLSSQSYDLTSQPDGAYTFLVQATDAAGNTGPPTTSSYTLDTTAPDPPTITTPPTTPGSGRSPSWSFTGEAGATFRCRLDRGSTQVSDWTSCSSPENFDLTGQPDGTYTFSVRATDADGNSGLQASSDYTLDTTNPAAPTIVSAPASPGSGRAPSWSFSAEGGASFECSLTGPGGTVSGWSSCSSGQSYSLSGQPDGAYTFSVRATDTAGNTGNPATSDYELDTAAPAAPSIGPEPSSPSNANSASWSFSGEAGAGFECRLDRGGTAVSGWGSCTSPHAYDLTAQPDGAYTFSVRATDAAGNTGPVAVSSTYTRDTSPPAAPSIDSAPPATASSRSPSWSFSGEAGAGFECRLDRGTTAVYGWAGCSGTKSFDLSGQPDGAYTFSVRATDPAGNVGASATSGYELDTTAPDPPSIDSSPGAAGRSGDPTWSFSGDAGTSFQCRLDRGATTVSDWTACTSPKGYDISAGPDGDYTFSVQAVDAANNTSTPSTSHYVLDTTAPGAPAIEASPASPGNDATPSWSFSSEAGASFECRLDRNGTAVSGWAACDTPKSYDLSSEPDGTYSFSVRATDTVGNTGPAATRDYTLDTAAPAAPLIGTSPKARDNDLTPTWSASGESGAMLQCRLDRGTTQIADWTTCPSPLQYDLTNDGDGSYRLSVRAVDAAGNTGAVSTSDYTLDTTGAAVTLGPAPASPGSSRSPSWTFSSEPGATFECRLEFSGSPSGWTACTSPATFGLSGQPDGIYTFYVRATDTVGNTGAEASNAYTLDTTAPAAPTIVSSPGAVGANVTPSWSFSGEAGATFQCQLVRGNTTVSDWSSCPSPRGYDLTGQPDGTYTFSVRAVDSAGNAGPQRSDSYQLVATAPGAPTLVASPGPIGNTRLPAWSFSGDAGASYQCRLTLGSAAISDWSSCTSPRAYDLTGLPDSTFTFEVRALNILSAIGPAAMASYTLDTTPPAAPSFLSKPGALGNGHRPTWTFSGEAGATFQCRLDRGATAILDWQGCASPHSADLSGKPDGVYMLSVRATDAAGNPSSPVADDYELDDTPPAAPSIDDGPGKEGTDRTPTWSFSGERGASFECRLMRGAARVDDWSACKSPRKYDLSKENTGDYTFSVRATDDAGNTGAARTSDYTLDSASGQTSAPAAPPASTGPAPPAPGPAPAATPAPGAQSGSRGMRSHHGRAGSGRRGHGHPVPRSPLDHALPVPSGRGKPGAQVTPSGVAHKHRRHQKHGAAAAVGAVAENLKRVAAVVAKNADKGAFPAALLFMVFGFLTIQGRMDRNDPKLALAPVFAEPDLEFDSPPDDREEDT